MDSGTSPYVGRVADLVNPYMRPSPGLEGRTRARTTGGRDISAWLEAHPGRWAMVFENGMGTLAGTIKKLGYNFSERDRDTPHMRVYAQNPHPEAESLKDALARTPSLYLPKLERDPFNWTPAELAEACQIARDNLFPTDGRWNGNRRRRR
jgi:hypothetical protein